MPFTTTQKKKTKYFCFFDFTDAWTRGVLLNGDREKSDEAMTQLFAI
jgi:hypothetical protein